MLRLFSLLLLLVTLGCATHSRAPEEPKRALVLMTDFGLADGAVSAMKGVAFETAPRLHVADLTHEIPPYNIWEGGYRLQQTWSYWPSGTVFVTVVDPGVGSERKSIAARTKSGHVFVGPDNGLFTLVQDEAGFEAVREIDEGRQRLKGSKESYTFHGRDLYVYVGARLASGQLAFEDVGAPLKENLVRLSYQKPEANSSGLKGVIPVLDPNYGNVWTNLPKAMVTERFAGAKTLLVRIFQKDQKLFEARVPLVDTFAAVPQGRPLLYFNSLLNLSLALNMDSFAKKHKIGYGPDWTLTVAE